MTAVRPFAPADLERVMEIWLAANLQAHGFVPAEYWTGNAPQVRQQLPQAELYVYETGGVVQGFAGLQGDYLAGIFVVQGTTPRTDAACLPAEFPRRSLLPAGGLCRHRRGHRPGHRPAGADHGMAARLKAVRLSLFCLFLSALFRVYPL